MPSPETVSLGSTPVPEQDQSLESRQRFHPNDRKYINIAVILAVLTAIEVAVYYLDISQGVLVSILMPLMIAKFFIVAGYFMHLKFDSPMFTKLFLAGLSFASVIYTVMLLTFRYWE